MKFPILNIIHLEKRLDRKQSYMEEMNTQGIPYKEWEGIIYKPAHTGISKAHKQIVSWAKFTGKPFVAIAEDDIKFSCPGAWKYFLSKIPKSFDLYCGLIYDGEVDPTNNRIITTRGMSGTNTLYIIHSRFYDFFLSIDESKHLDRELGRFSNINEYYVCHPMVCTQMGGYSDNHRRDLTYDVYLKGKQLLGQ